MKTPASKHQVIPPWTTVSSVDIQNALDSRIAQTIGRRKSKRKIALDSLPSIRETLISVFGNDEALQGEAEQTLESMNPEEILIPFLSAEPKWVIRCSVTDSLVSGIWGLKYFVLGSRGYLYYHPDFGIDDPGECLPIVGTWESSPDKSAALATLKDAYIAYWMDFALPPSMGQWARGPRDFLTDAVGVILQQRASRWSDVLDRLRSDTNEDGTKVDLVRFLTKQVSFQTKVAESAVSNILTDFFAERHAPARKINLSELESQVLVSAFVTRIGMGGF